MAHLGNIQSDLVARITKVIFDIEDIDLLDCEGKIDMIWHVQVTIRNI